MTRTASLLMAVVLVIGGVSAFPMAAAAQSGSSIASIGGSTYAQVNENASENATAVTPGERLSAVVGVGQAEFEGELELRAYGIEYASAMSNDSKAQVVGERLTTIEQRLAELEAQKAELDQARENGSIDEGEYQARATELSARSKAVEQLAEASEDRAGELPADVLQNNDINVTAIQLLRQNASELTGPQVAAIAQSIAGPDVGTAITRGPPGDIGAPSPDARSDGDRGAGDAQAAIDRAEEQLDATERRIDEVEQRVNETNASENATEAIALAREELEQARAALADARAALDDGNGEDAVTLAEDALAHAEQAEAHAEDALEAAQDAGDGAGGQDGGSGAGTSGSAGGSDS